MVLVDGWDTTNVGFVSVHCRQPMCSIANESHFAAIVSGIDKPTKETVMFHTECECGAEIVSFKLKTHCPHCEYGLNDPNLVVESNNYDNPFDLDDFEEDPIEDR